MLIVKVGYRQAVVHGIIRCLAELAGSGIIELQFLRQESASGLANPETGGGIESHRLRLEPALKGFVRTDNFQNFLQGTHRREGETVVAFAHEQLFAFVSAERLPVHKHDAVYGNLTQNFHQDATLPVGCLADTDITRYGVVGVRILATLFYLSVIPSKHKII